MITPVPTLILVAVLLGIVLVWWWSSRSRVTLPPPPVAMAAQRIVFPGGIHLGKPDGTGVALERPDEIVIPFEHAVLVIDFPLTTPAEVQISAPLPIGFTRRALVHAICDEYAHIYAAEEGTAAIKPIPVEDRGPDRARNRTDGAYGIWGHDLEDLVIESAHWMREPDGTVKIELHVVSRAPAS